MPGGLVWSKKSGSMISLATSRFPWLISSSSRRRTRALFASSDIVLPPFLLIASSILMEIACVWCDLHHCVWHDGLRRGHDAELLHQAELVHLVPMIRDLSIGDSQDVDHIDLHLLARR